MPVSTEPRDTTFFHRQRIKAGETHNKMPEERVFGIVVKLHARVNLKTQTQCVLVLVSVLFWVWV